MRASHSPRGTGATRLSPLTEQRGLAGPGPWWSGEVGAWAAVGRRHGDRTVARQQLLDPMAASELVGGAKQAMGPAGLWLCRGTWERAAAVSPAWGRANTEPGGRAPGCAEAGAGAPGKATAQAGKCCHSCPGSGCCSGAGHRAGAGGSTGRGRRPLPRAGLGCKGAAVGVGGRAVDGGGSRVPGSRLPAPGSCSRLTAPGAAAGDVVTQTLTRGGITWKLWGQPWPPRSQTRAGSLRGSCRPLGLSGCWQWARGHLPKLPPLGVTPLQCGPGFSV